MPITTGQELCRKIKACPRLAVTPIVLMSGDIISAEEISALGANGFLQKPIESASLITTLASFQKVG